MDLFSDDMRRNPYPLYERMRGGSPLLHLPALNAFLVFDYDGVKRVLGDHEAFSSKLGPQWLIFFDPPRHEKMRALVSRAFTPRSVAALEPRIRDLSRGLLDSVIERGEMDLALDYSVPLPMAVIAEMLGVPADERARLDRWSDAILALSHDLLGGKAAAAAHADYVAVTEEMDAEIAAMIERRRRAPREDLLTRLVEAEVGGERLTLGEIVGFVQILLVGGQETTTNLVNNAILCLLENPDQFARLKARAELLPAAIEEVLRYRSPLQWTPRVATRDVEVHGRVVPKGSRMLAMIGSANHDATRFPDPGRFDIARDPNPHLAFGLGIHFCLGSALARMEARIALTDLLGRLDGIQRANNEPWEPRRALHVHGPSRLPIQFKVAASTRD